MGLCAPFSYSEKARQGFPLSPLLFLLAIKDLSQLIILAKRRGKLKGIEVATNLFISHLLFVDDIFLFSNGNREDVYHLKNILDLFLKATIMVINLQESSITNEGISGPNLAWISTILRFSHHPVGESLKYLGFFLKPDAYKKYDWIWLSKIEKRINIWSYKWLSRAGRLVLIKSVLLAIPVYWIALS